MKRGDLMSLSEPTAQWSPFQNILFRAGFIYAVMVMLLDGILSVIIPAPLRGALWDPLILFVGEKVFDVEIVTRPNGSGDTLYNYVQLFTIFLTSILGTVIWSVLGKRQPDYRRWLDGLRVAIRCYLGLSMITYGSAKIIKTQFPNPDISKLLQPYGDSSPMGLLWTFMGYSKAYNLFAGLGEAVGGVLLFYKKTTLLGSLIVIGVMSNVVVLNFSYDVPVKIFSSHLLLMAIFLAAKDASRLYHFFWSQQQVPATKEQAYIQNQNISKGIQWLKGVFIALVSLSLLAMGISGNNRFGDERPLPPLHGLYDVESFFLNGEERPPLTTDSKRWHRFWIDYEGRATMETMDGQKFQLIFNPDTTNQTASVYLYPNATHTDFFTYHITTDSLLKLEGVYFRDTLSMVMRPKNLNDFLLLSRGFHWINEYPFNR